MSLIARPASSGQKASSRVIFNTHGKLRQLLLDPDHSVRDAAFATPETIGQRTGQALPR
jgi:hypothetical protein